MFPIDMFYGLQVGQTKAVTIDDHNLASVCYCAGEWEKNGLIGKIYWRFDGMNQWVVCFQGADDGKNIIVPYVKDKAPLVVTQDIAYRFGLAINLAEDVGEFRN